MEENLFSKLEDIKHLLKQEDKDYLLVRLIELANHGIRAPITLNVGGSIVTGILTSGGDYYKAFGERLVQGLGDDLSATLLEEFNELAKNYEDSPDDLASKPYKYIHLTNANVVSSRGFVPSDGQILWRGKVSSVDAFWFGTLGG